ncbi:hypothetical protein ECZC10_54640 [Escherichia coli]|nr:hypothetical protein ECZC10_54640 [Escherichia coli]
MEFKDLPKEIQTITATTLSDSLVEIKPESAKKKPSIIWFVMCAMRLPGYMVLIIKSGKRC